MTINVMLVDDSTIVRALIARMLTHEDGIKVVATAGDGHEAINTAKLKQPDVIVLDIEMPVMDGLTALPLLLEALPKVRIIMVSRLTRRNAATSLRALELGAADYIPKPENDSELDSFCTELTAKIRALTKTNVVTKPLPASSQVAIRAKKPTTVQALAIAASTGGPQALLKLFAGLKGHLSHLPIFVTQHMPAVFTSVMADHIKMVSGFHCAEGKEGEVVTAGHVYIAPGNHHMLIKKQGAQNIICINQDPPVNFCRPAADPMFKSLSHIYGANLLALVMTGMGQDGTDGAKAIAANGGMVIAQDAASSVVYGMPKVVAEAGICEAILSLDDIAPYLIKRC